MNLNKEKPSTFHLKIRFWTREQLDVYGVARFSVEQDRKSKDIYFIQWKFVNGQTQYVTRIKQAVIQSFIVKEEKKNVSNK